MADNTQFFNRPVPGSSLTRTPKSAPWQNPPRFAKLDDALEHTFNKITQPKSIYMISKLLESGATVESIARTMALAGVAHGEWTHPIDKGMIRPLTYQIAAVAHRAGVKNIKVTNPDTKMQKFQDEMAALELKTGKRSMAEDYTTDEAASTGEDTPPISNILNRENIPVDKSKYIPGDDITSAPTEDTSTADLMAKDKYGADYTASPDNEEY